MGARDRGAAERTDEDDCRTSFEFNRCGARWAVGLENAQASPPTILDFGFWILDCGFWSSDLGRVISDFRFEFSDFKLEISNFRSEISAAALLALPRSIFVTETFPAPNADFKFDSQ